MPANLIEDPWLSFLKEIDDSLRSKIAFHCFGAFAITIQFGLPRETSDVDVMSGVVREHQDKLVDLAGKDSSLHKKHSVYLDVVGAIATVPDNYEDRLIPIAAPFSKIRFYVMEVHDIVLAKLCRDHPKDIQDVEYLARVTRLDTGLLKERYRSELRHNVIGPLDRADGILEYWINVVNEIQGTSHPPIID